MNIQQNTIKLIKCIVLFLTIYTLIYIYQCNAPNLGQSLRKDCSSNSIDKTTINKTDIFIGIFTTKEKFTRRQMIRNTYIRNKPNNLVYKFIIAENIAKQQLEEEMKLYNDILVLDMEQENMNKGKTYEFFKAISETTEYNKIDFVLKADDDAYLYLDRIQYDLAHTVRNMTYWGYLVGNTFMAGQCYGLSMDLVHWVSNSNITKKYKSGHEDSQVQKWFQWAKINDRIKYEVRNCRIHDYIDSGSVYAREIDLNSSMVVHYLKDDTSFMKTHQTFSLT